MYELDEPQRPVGEPENPATLTPTPEPTSEHRRSVAPRRRGPWRTVGVAVAGAVVGGALVTAAVPTYRVWAQGLPQIATVPVSPDSQAGNSPAVSVFQKVSPAVVLVTNHGAVQNTFFGPQSQTAWGSGVIFSSDGYIVTNDHVVQGASSVTVTLSDGTTHPAQVVGGDASTDLAVIKINTGKALPTAAFADSSSVTPGDLAIAIGNPLGPQYAQSVTQGIVGAVRPMLYGLDPNQSRVTEMIQTDAPVNPGNSGGPLCNAQGEVIGIVSMKTVTAEPGVQAVGLSFAIPSSTVQKIVDQLVQNGYVKWPWLGIGIQEDPSSQNTLSTDPQTLTIDSVTQGGPSHGKLQPGDVMSTWNGKKIVNYWNLVGDITEASPGQAVTIGVLRNGKAVNVEVTLGTEPKSQATAPVLAQPTAPSPSSGVTPFPFPFGQ